MPSLQFHPKVAAAGVSGSLSVLILWGLSYVISIPDPVQTAITALVAVGCAWAAPHLSAEKKS